MCSSLRPWVVLVLEQALVVPLEELLLEGVVFAQEPVCFVPVEAPVVLLDDSGDSVLVGAGFEQGTLCFSLGPVPSVEAVLLVPVQARVLVEAVLLVLVLVRVQVPGLSVEPGLCELEGDSLQRAYLDSE